VARNALYGHSRALAPWRAAPSSIVFHDFIGLAFQRGIGATRPAGGVCRSVGRTCDGHARSSRVRRDGRGGARAPSPPSFPPSLLGLGIVVGKGWEVVLIYEIRGRGGRRSYYSTELGGRGVPKRHTLGTKHRNHNISPGRFWRVKSFVLVPQSPTILASNLKIKEINEAFCGDLLQEINVKISFCLGLYFVRNNY